jgi:hypothetical protein
MRQPHCRSRFYGTDMPRISYIRIIEPLSATDMAPSSFEKDLAWAEKRGVNVERLFYDPFSQDTAPEHLAETSPLPLVLVDGNMALSGRYPTREEIGVWMMFGFVAANDRNPGGIRCCTL